MSVLIAEDYAPARFLRSRILADAGFAVSEADTAEATMNAVLHDPPPSLVLLDVGLPDGNGFEICERIKAAAPELPVVLISAIYRTAHARRDGFTAGADAYLVDPTPPARLVQTVRQLTSPDAAPAPAPPGIVHTTSSGYIVWVNDIAGRLLNITERAAPGRNLLTFFNGDRARIQSELARAAGGQVCELEAALRPRERKPFDIRIDLSPSSDGERGQLEWVFEPI